MAVAELPEERPSFSAVLHDWVTTVDHKKIGIMYILMAVVFLVIGGIEALLIRWQQDAKACAGRIGPAMTSLSTRRLSWVISSIMVDLRMNKFVLKCRLSMC